MARTRPSSRRSQSSSPRRQRAARVEWALNLTEDQHSSQPSTPNKPAREHRRSNERDSYECDVADASTSYSPAQFVSTPLRVAASSADIISHFTAADLAPTVGETRALNDVTERDVVACAARAAEEIAAAHLAHDAPRDRMSDQLKDVAAERQALYADARTAEWAFRQEQAAAVTAALQQVHMKRVQHAARQRALDKRLEDSTHVLHANMETLQQRDRCARCTLNRTRAAHACSRRPAKPTRHACSH